MMKRNIVIDPGIIPVDLVREAVKCSDYNVHFIQYESRKKVYEKEWENIGNTPFHIYSEFLSGKFDLGNQDTIRNVYNDVYNGIVSDYRTMQIAERVKFRLKPSQNDFNELINISNLILAYLNWFDELKPAFLFYQASPHELCSWTLAKVAEALGIPVFKSKTSALPWKSMLVKGIDGCSSVANAGTLINRADPNLVKSYYELNISKYDKAIPSYERKRLEARKGKFWSWKKEFKELVRKPYRIVATMKKYSLLKYYQSLSTKQISDGVKGKYVIVFLHFQPERTSLPEGLFFTQQLHLIRTLSLALPDYRIYVKEHPSMFVGHFDIRYRNKEFYKCINEMPNVELVDITIDSFSLLDNSLCIATITGTVGVQSLIRGRSVLCFGNASYTDFEGCYKIVSCKDVEDAINDIRNKESDSRFNLSQITLDRLIKVDQEVISGIDEDVASLDYYNQKYRLHADGLVLKYLLNGYDIVSNTDSCGNVC